MKRFLLVMALASAVSFAVNPIVFASSDIDATIDVTIEDDVDSIDDTASTPDGQTTVVDKIEKEFGVDEATIQDLRAQKFGYGEITIALSLAERLPGGLTPENIDKVVSMRQGPPVAGWGNIARDLGLKINPAAERLDRIDDETAKPERAVKVKHEGTEGLEKAQKPERVEKAQRPERVEKVEKIERIERPEKPEKGGRK